MKFREFKESKKGRVIIKGGKYFLVFLLGGLFLGGGSDVTTERYNELLKVEEDYKVVNSSYEKLSQEKEVLSSKVNEVTAFFNLEQSDKDLANQYMIDLKNKSDEEKKAEQERIKAEQEAKAKAEQEAKAKAEAEAKAKAEAEEQAKKEAERNKYNTGITFEDLARNPQENTFKLLTFTGKIIQVMKGDGYTQYRMAVNSDYDKVVLVEVQNSLLSKGNILEDDVITIRGKFVMEQTYTTVMGAEKTIPAIVADEVDY